MLRVIEARRQRIGNALLAEGFIEAERDHPDEGSEWYVSDLIHWKSNQARSVERAYGAKDAADLARLRRLFG